MYLVTGGRQVTNLDMFPRSYLGETKEFNSRVWPSVPPIMEDQNF